MQDTVSTAGTPQYLLNEKKMDGGLPINRAVIEHIHIPALFSPKPSLK